jgi:hypothetical protein
MFHLRGAQHIYDCDKDYHAHPLFFLVKNINLWVRLDFDLLFFFFGSEN